MQILVDAGVCKDGHAASGLINHHVPQDIISAKDADTLAKWGKAYRGYRDEGDEPEQAAAKATASIPAE